MRKELNDFTTSLHERDEADLAGTYEKCVHVMHEDGSEFKVMHARVEKAVVAGFDVTVLFCEHQGVMTFVDVDLETVTVTPWKGRSKKVKLARYKNGKITRA